MADGTLIHGIFLTFEPNYSSSPELLKFYYRNILSYARAAKTMDNFKLTVVDSGSSPEFTEFLQHVTTRLKIGLFLIAENISSFDAANRYIWTVRNTKHLYLWLASDTRTRCAAWLQDLIQDINFSGAKIIYPTCTADGSVNTPQTQKNSINTQPLALHFPNFCHTICLAVAGEVLEKFDWRLPDKFKKNGNCKGVALMALALDEPFYLSLRCNISHLQSFSGKHQWTNDKKRKGRIEEYTHLSILESGLNAYGTNEFSQKQFKHQNAYKGFGEIQIWLRFLNFLRGRICKSSGRKKLLLNFAYCIIASQNKSRFLELNFETRKRIVSDMYWAKQ